MFFSTRTYGFYPIKRIYYKVLKKFHGPIKLPSQDRLISAKLPSGGEFVSVEKAINSRCSSDYDENQQRDHWGLFDKNTTISTVQVQFILECVKFPRFSEHRVEIKAEGNLLTFVIDNHVSGPYRDLLMVESGMQQQAVGLVCAALGVGIKFRNMGLNGSLLSVNDYGNIQIRLDFMKPSYDGSYWTDAPLILTKKKAYNNLSEPMREGSKPLIKVLENISTEKAGQSGSSENTISQLLWAARGRVPHLYYSKPYGLTIPSWEGRQEDTSVYYIADNSLYLYVNWIRNRPAHCLHKIKDFDQKQINDISNLLNTGYKTIIIGKHENTGRALWQVGYQLLNLIVQAKNHDISYKSQIFEMTEKAALKSVGIEDAVAAISI